MAVTDEQKVLLATFMLKGDARRWWEVTKQRLSAPMANLENNDAPPIPTVITWAMFTKAFHEKYFPRSYQMGQRREFLKLEQGKMTVAEYEARFTTLSRFALNLVSTDEDKCRMFEDGLNIELRPYVANQRLNNFADMIEVATNFERDLGLLNEQREQNKKRKTESTSGGRNFGQQSIIKGRGTSTFQSHGGSQFRGFQSG
ncbi:uncharacterized protein LOC131323981 [Rhododendron vialii]|uniref:uncharacterized protein LOC131323981 n=1 Tax=Rhododendron vialii TaxID=182163 RepID=UPI00265F45AC|nr:uncharacterized protein LOC131323981 [Rhododendron vialii]